MKMFTLFLVLCLCSSTLFSQNQKLVSEVLDENGRIKSGVNGSFNASGYTLDYGKNNEPIFKKSNSPQKVTTITWSALGTGVTAGRQVYAIAVSGSDVYVGGGFTATDDSAKTVNYIAKWNGSTWSALGSGASNGTNGTVQAIAVSGSDVYVGGSFTTAGGNPANNIAKWNGSAWSALGSGVNNGVGGNVFAIADSGSNVYVGGAFTTAGGSPANYIAKWNGSAWSALGAGTTSTVHAIAVSGSNNVYVGGEFIAGHFIALWNSTTSTWSALGVGVNGSVYTIAVSGSNVYVGGAFTKTYDNVTTLNYIAKWDGTNWSAMGTGVGNVVNAIAVSGSDVYVGGQFAAYQGPASYIAKWNGAVWSALGGGTNNTVYALAVNANAGAMMVGGVFSTVDNSIAVYCIAQFIDSGNPLPVELQSLSAVSKLNTVELNWTTATEENNCGFEVEREVSSQQSVVSSWEKIGLVKGSGNSNSHKNYSYVDDNPVIGKAEYRLKMIDNDGTFNYSSIVEAEVAMPMNYELKQNFPNPFNPNTVISYSLPFASNVKLIVFNSLGQTVKVIENRFKNAGNYSVNLNAAELSSGTYYYKIEAGQFSQIKKMILLK